MTLVEPLKYALFAEQLRMRIINSRDLSDPQMTYEINLQILEGRVQTINDKYFAKKSEWSIGGHVPPFQKYLEVLKGEVSKRKIIISNEVIVIEVED